MAQANPPMGLNRTGLQMSPFDAAKMRDELPQRLIPPAPGDASALIELRSIHDREAGSLGSVALPGSFKGAVTAGVAMLSGDKPQLLLDKLGERLAFERTGVRLYDALIAKMQSGREAPISGMTLNTVQRLRDEEAAHFALLVYAIESLGGDPTSETPCADVAGIEAEGLIKVMTDPRTSLAQCLHALLVAELADDVGWDLLIAIAESQGQHSLIADFRAAHDHEHLHGQIVCDWLRTSTLG